MNWIERSISPTFLNLIKDSQSYTHLKYLCSLNMNMIISFLSFLSPMHLGDLEEWMKMERERKK